MYKKYYNVEAPSISYEIALCFVDYAKKRGINNFKENLDKIKNVDKESDEWFNRNQQYYEIIKSMRLSGVCGFETTGEFEGLPTINELKLIQLMSSSLTSRVIKKMIKKMGFLFKSKYKLEK